MTATLTWLLDGIAALPANEARVADVTLDSREVRQGSLFLALAGGRDHGLKFAADAAARGAGGLVASISILVPTRYIGLMPGSIGEALSSVNTRVASQRCTSRAAWLRVAIAHMIWSTSLGSMSSSTATANFGCR